MKQLLIIGVRDRLDAQEYDDMKNRLRKYIPEEIDIVVIDGISHLAIIPTPEPTAVAIGNADTMVQVANTLEFLKRMSTE